MDQAQGTSRSNLGGGSYEEGQQIVGKPSLMSLLVMRYLGMERKDPD
jgi:hypothetical protein